MNFFSQKILLAVGNVRCNPGSIDTNLCNPFYNWSSNVTDLQSFVEQLMKSVGDIIGLLAIAAIIYGAFRMVVANGDDGQIKTAKRIITYAIYGLGLSILAYTIVIAIENFIGVRSLPGPETPGNVDTKPLEIIFGQKNLRDYLIQLLKNVLGIVGIVSIAMIVANGFKYLTARGDDNQVKGAKKGLTWALAGVILSILSYIIVTAFVNLLS